MNFESIPLSFQKSLIRKLIKDRARVSTHQFPRTNPPVQALILTLRGSFDIGESLFAQQQITKHKRIAIESPKRIENFPFKKSLD